MGVIKERWYPFKWEWLILIIVILLVIFIRIRLLEVPLERDEGEYAYAGQLLLQGIPPYIKAYNMKLPGIYGVYALILAVFGQDHIGIHLGLLVVNIATIVIMFFLGKKLLEPLTGLIAAIGFALLSVSGTVQGVFANAEHFVLLPALGGILLLLRAIEYDRSRPFLVSGFLLGMAFVIKQHGAAFVVFGATYLLVKELASGRIGWWLCLRKCGLLSVGAAIPFGLMCLYLYLTGVYDRFLFWTFDYAIKYVSAVTPVLGLQIFYERVSLIADSSILIWVLAAVGLTALIWDKKARSLRLFISSFFVFSFLAICPGFYFRPHYFILLLPSIALLLGIGVTSIGRLVSRALPQFGRYPIPLILLFMAMLHLVYAQKAFLFHMSPRMVSRTVYVGRPFPESLEIASYIKKHSSLNDTIAVIGSEPQIYFYSQRHSATGYIYMYPLMENHALAKGMQEEMIVEIEDGGPIFLVLVNVRTSWLRRAGSEVLIFSWLKGYLKDHYKRVGIVDIIAPDHTEYYWNDHSVGYRPRSKYWVAVYKRKA
jgi:hypothetical protein